MCAWQDVRHSSEDAPLDMRMDQRQRLTARDVVNTYSETELYRIIRDYGEDKFAKNIAKHMIKAREEKEIETAGELTEIIKRAIPAKVRKKYSLLYNLQFFPYALHSSAVSMLSLLSFLCLTSYAFRILSVSHFSLVNYIPVLLQTAEQAFWSRFFPLTSSRIHKPENPAGRYMDAHISGKYSLQFCPPGNGT